VGESRPNHSGEAETLRTGLQIPSGMGSRLDRSGEAETLRTGLQIPSGMGEAKHCGRDCKSRPACPACMGEAERLRTGLQIPSGMDISYQF